MIVFAHLLKDCPHKPRRHGLFIHVSSEVVRQRKQESPFDTIPALNQSYLGVANSSDKLVTTNLYRIK